MAWKKKTQIDEGSADVNAAKYMDLAITNALTVVPKAIENGENMANALLSLTISIDQLENICRADKTLDDQDEEYNKAIEAFLKAQTEENKDIKRAQLANFKMRLLLERAFESGIKDADLNV